MCLQRIKAWWAAKKATYNLVAELGYQVGFNKAKELDEKYHIKKGEQNGKTRKLDY